VVTLYRRGTKLGVCCCYVHAAFIALRMMPDLLDRTLFQSFISIFFETRDGNGFYESSSSPENCRCAILMLLSMAVVLARIVQYFALFYGRFLCRVLYAHFVHTSSFSSWRTCGMVAKTCNVVT